MAKPFLVIMAGGRGERFWPRSRRNYPKQFLAFNGEQSLLQESVARIRPLTDDARIYVVTNKEQVTAVLTQLPFLPISNIIVEPEGRNTAPCIGLAAAYIQKRHPEEDPVIAFLPSDSMVFSPEEMRRVLEAGFTICDQQDTGVIYGVRPSRPETGFGYIELGKKLGTYQEVPFHQVAAFKEKPDGETARKYVACGEYLWNGGVFVWKLDRLMLEIRESLPGLYQGLVEFINYIGKPDEMSKLTEIYPTLPATSVDYGILEKSSHLVVVPTDYGWDDLGSWSALERFLPRDESDNVIQGQHVGVDTKDCIIHSPGKLVTTLGVSDLIIVETDDVLMVCHKDQTQHIKKLLQKLADEGHRDLL